MTGLEVPALLLGKFLIGKAITWGGAHVLAGASSATLTHLSMHAGVNAIAGVTGAGSALGAATSAGSSILAYKGFATAIQERKEKNARVAYMASLKPGALGDVPGPLKDELVRAVYESLQTVYQGLDHKDPGPEKKTSLEKIEICMKEDCDCLDYDYDEDEESCTCGHSTSFHKRPTSDQVDLSLLLLYLVAKEVYPELRRENESGDWKRDIDDMDPCSKCGCTDFRKGYLWCWCDHSADAHNSTSEECDLFKKREALVEVLAEKYYQDLDHSDHNNCTKRYLYQIRPCFKSGCWDFKYSWTLPFSDTNMCKCGSRDISHTAYRAA